MLFLVLITFCSLYDNNGHSSQTEPLRSFLFNLYMNNYSSNESEDKDENLDTSSTSTWLLFHEYPSEEKRIVKRQNLTLEERMSLQESIWLTNVLPAGRENSSGKSGFKTLTLSQIQIVKLILQKFSTTTWTHTLIIIHRFWISCEQKHISRLSRRNYVDKEELKFFLVLSYYITSNSKLDTLHLTQS